MAAIDQRVYFVEKPEKKKLLVSLLREEDKSVLVFPHQTRSGQIFRVCSPSRVFEARRFTATVAESPPARTHGFQVRQDPGDGRYGHRCPWHRHPGTEIVINYDLPDVPETYVHRIGRTGRAGHSGTAPVLHPGRAAAHERHTAADRQKTQCGNIPCIIIFKLNLMAKSQTFGKRENEKKKSRPSASKNRNAGKNARPEEAPRSTI